MPPMRNLWRLHDSEGAVDERWTSLQLTKDEKTGNLFIIETRKEWFPGNSGSQRTCYRKELHFETQAKVPRPEHSLHTPLESAIDSLEEEEWRSEDHIEERSSEKIHIGDGPSDATAYTLEECFVLSYNTSCNAFVDLVYEGDNPDSRLQLRVQPMKQEPSVRIFKRPFRCHSPSGNPVANQMEYHCHRTRISTSLPRQEKGIQRHVPTLSDHALHFTRR
ncbi:hypothetical protein IWW34DRAFT_810705 [Fusarium oxysporum f. sp. albedinis]|nr:hypothetical protein IWW34DRAFT_810705 [Fusarium oxysporum f. sp. albedinis]